MSLSVNLLLTVLMCVCCRIITAGEKREVWCLILENVSPAMKPEEEEREQDMYRDVSQQKHTHTHKVKELETTKNMINEPETLQTRKQEN